MAGSRSEQRIQSSEFIKSLPHFGYYDIGWTRFFEPGSMPFWCRPEPRDRVHTVQGPSSTLTLSAYHGIPVSSLFATDHCCSTRSAHSQLFSPLYLSCKSLEKGVEEVKVKMQHHHRLHTHTHYSRQRTRFTTLPLIVPACSIDWRWIEQTRRLRSILNQTKYRCATITRHCFLRLQTRLVASPNVSCSLRKSWG